MYTNMFESGNKPVNDDKGELSSV